MDATRVHSLCEWMAHVLGRPVPSFPSSLASGAILCELVAAAVPYTKPSSKLYTPDAHSLQRYLK